MSYVVLARKYRPQTLSEVIGQDAVVQTLTNVIALSRIHHAYLFTGARGVGKTSIARILAKSLNCEKGPTATPCGVCAVCTEIARSASPDVLEIDGASNTSVDDVRDLRETVKYMPSRGRYKIYIIDEVHMLSTSAFNALLKTLEEPPAHVIFVFATTEPHKIPITILSRCQRFDFRRVPTSILAERLATVATAENVKLQPPALQLIAKAADGSVRDAMSLLDQCIAFAGNDIGPEQAQRALGLLDREKVRALLHAVLGKNRAAASKLVQEAFASGADVAEIAERLVEAVRDLALAKMTDGQAETLSGLLPEDVQSLVRVADGLGAADLQRLFATIAKAAEDTAKSPFAHLTFEMGLLRACDLEPVAALTDIINELRGGAPTSNSSGGGTGGGSRQSAERAQTSAAPRAERDEGSRTSALDPRPGPVGLSVVGPATITAASPAPNATTGPNATMAMTGARPDARGGATASALQPAPPVLEVTPVAPVSLAAPLSAPATTESPADYKAFAAQVTALKPRLGAALENVLCERFAPDVIAVRVPAGNEVFGDMLLDPESQATLQELTVKLFGRRVAIEVSRGGAEAASKTLAGERRSERQDEVRRLKQLGAEHPAVQKVLAVLGGDIRDVRVARALSHPAEDYE